MNTSGSIKHVFPGSNTHQGFYSLFANILPPTEANRTYIIKGGPGTGKSSFMKRIGTYAASHGFDAEYFHCSSDPNSLDAVVIPALKVSFLDGTAPHVMDPRYPGAVDKILNFGLNWDESKLIASRKEIIDCSETISGLFTKAYFYLAASKSIYDSYVYSEKKCINTTAKSNIENKIFTDLLGGVAAAEGSGKERHLFSTAITGEGILDYLHTIIGNTKKVYFIKETLGCNSKDLMNRIKDEALRKGLSIECYHSPVDIDKIEDILIPELDSVITVSNPIHKPKVFPTHIYDLTSSLDPSLLRNFELDLDRDKKLFNDLIDKGVHYIAEAKKLHDVLENYYIGAIDFTRVDTMYEELINDLFPEVNQA